MLIVVTTLDNDNDEKLFVIVVYPEVKIDLGSLKAEFSV